MKKACQFDAGKVLDNVAHIDPGKMYRMPCMCGKICESYSLERIKVEDGEKRNLKQRLKWKTIFLKDVKHAKWAILQYRLFCVSKILLQSVRLC